jgi:EPS-associated MarR family transcriptional regulator
MVFPDPNHYKLLKLIEANPVIQQRDMAKAMGVSLGKANYCLKALMQKGLVKMDNFRRSDNKLAYSYLLTPSGIEAKARLTVSFLKYKVAEYEAIRNEIEELRREAEKEATV